MKRKICIITGSRADYGVLFKVMKAVESHPKLKLYIIATCMHLMKEFGATIKEIKRDGLKIYEKINISYARDTAQAIASSIGRAVFLFSRSFAGLRPDLIVVLGDRPEMLAVAITANYMNIPVAHIHGGEISGHVDGVVRHAITKLAHIHFPATLISRERILKLGEEPWRVFFVGAPALDSILDGKASSSKELTEKYRLIKGKPLLLLIQHPVSTESNKSGRHIKITLEAIKVLKLPTIIIYPNADSGGRAIISVIREYSKKLKFIKTFKSLAHRDYLGLMKIASVLIGNSSSGIIEAPAFGLPVVNIGIRQKGRQRCQNVIDSAHNKKEIIKAVKMALYQKRFINQAKNCINCYGDGHASERIVKVLSTIKIDKKLLEKQLTY